MGKTATLLVPVLLAATAGVSLFAWGEYRRLEAAAPVVRKAALLQAENDNLRTALITAQRAASNAQDVLRRSQIERSASEIRELPFKTPVVYEMLDRTGIKQVVAGKLSEQYSDQEIRDISTGYAALGLLPKDFPLKQEYIDLLGEQIAAFYDQHQHKLFMFQDATLENAQNRVVLAHELTHALQDQNFGLMKLPLEARNNDDRAAAASALVEGDATLVMSQYMVKDLTWKTFTDTAQYSVTQSMEQIRKAPRYLREMLVFPYLKGQLFCNAAFERGGFPALSDVYRNPPSSTAQILHPEKYFAEPREEPITVGIPDVTFRNAKPLADNVLGEMGARILFAQGDEEKADSVAAGWRGDRYLVFDNGDSVVWHTVWSSRQAAEAAVVDMEGTLKRRFNESFARAGDDISSAEGGGHFARIQFVGANEVVLTLATTKESSDLLHQKFAGPSHG